LTDWKFLANFYSSNAYTKSVDLDKYIPPQYSESRRAV